MRSGVHSQGFDCRTPLAGALKLCGLSFGRRQVQGICGATIRDSETKNGKTAVQHYCIHIEYSTLPLKCVERDRVVNFVHMHNIFDGRKNVEQHEERFPWSDQRTSLNLSKNRSCTSILENEKYSSLFRNGPTT